MALFLFCLISGLANAQRWSTRSGSVELEASVPGFEDIRGLSSNASALVDLDKGHMAVLVPVQDIEFPNDLMQKHFNENYMDSDIYPKITFSGGWEGALVSGDRVELSGTMRIRDVEQEIRVPALARYEDGLWTFSGEFDLRPEDYGVQIPKVVRMKIAEVTRIRFDLRLQPLK